MVLGLSSCLIIKATCILDRTKKKRIMSVSENLYDILVTKAISKKTLILGYIKTSLSNASTKE